MNELSRMILVNKYWEIICHDEGTAVDSFIFYFPITNVYSRIIGLMQNSLFSEYTLSTVIIIKHIHYILDSYIVYTFEY